MSAFISLRMACISWSEFQLLRFAFENEVSPHATTREIFHALVVFGPICMRIEVALTLVPHIFEEFH